MHFYVNTNTYRYIHVRHQAQVTVGPLVGVVPPGGDEEVEEIVLMLEGEKHRQHLWGAVKGLAAECVMLDGVAVELEVLVAAGDDGGVVGLTRLCVTEAGLERHPAAVA